MEFVIDRAMTTDPARVRGFAGCRSALAATDLVSDPCRAGVADEPLNNLLLMDGDVHLTVRRLVMTYMSGERLHAAEDRLRAVCDGLVTAALADPGADLIADVAELLVLDAVLSVTEVRAEHRPKLSTLARSMLGLLEPDLPQADRRRAGTAALRATMLFERDGLAGTATGLHAALEAAARDGEIPVKMARTTPVVVLHGGYENPLNQLGCVLAFAVEHPDRFRDAAASAPDRLFEEIMRVYSPVRLVARWAAADGDYADLPMRRGEFAWVDLASGNRDPERFPDAEALDLSQRRGHLGFGYGRHTCPGTGLARLEGRLLIEALRTVPPARLGEYAVAWRDGLVARGPRTITRSR